MKLDDLLTHDNMVIDPDEWTAYLELGPTKGSMQMKLVEAYGVGADVFLRYEFTAMMNFSFIGYRVMRAWVDDTGTIKMRTVRMDTWVPAFVAMAGDAVEIEVLIHPEDWA